MYIRVETEISEIDGRAYVTGWSICPKAQANDIQEDGVFIFKSKFVWADFYKNTNYWYVKDNQLRKNPHRVMA